MQRLRPGMTVDGFVLGEKLPSGCMASLWRATNPGLDFPLLLKIPFLDRGQDVSVIIGFEVEAMILKRLCGPHVPRFAGSGDLTDIPYIATELVAGDSVAEKLKRDPCPIRKPLPSARRSLLPLRQCIGSRWRISTSSRRTSSWPSAADATTVRRRLDGRSVVFRSPTRTDPRLSAKTLSSLDST